MSHEGSRSQLLFEIFVGRHPNLPCDGLQGVSELRRDRISDASPAKLVVQPLESDLETLVRRTDGETHQPREFGAET